MNTRTEVDAGICGFRTSVRATSDDGQNVSFNIASGCEKVRLFADALKAHGAVDAYEEISPAGQSIVLSLARNSLMGCCAACVVPSAVFKSRQVAAGLALPRDIAISIRSE